MPHSQGCREGPGSAAPRGSDHRKQPAACWGLPSLLISAGSGQVSPDRETEFGPGSSRAFTHPSEPGTPGDGFSVSLLEEGFADSPVSRGEAGPPAAHPLHEQQSERWGEGSVSAGLGQSALSPSPLRTPCPCRVRSPLGDPWGIPASSASPSAGGAPAGSQRLSSTGVRGWLCPRQDAGAPGADEVSNL